MKSELMRLAIMWHLRYKLQYPWVATECLLATQKGAWWIESYADVFAIKKSLMVEVELKRHRWEIKKDLETKIKKHAFYLHPQGPWESSYKRWDEVLIRPHKFYFATHASSRNRHKHTKDSCPEIPKEYGLIMIYDLYDCTVIRPAKYLHRNSDKIEEAKRRMSLRLVAENINLRLRLGRRESDGKYEAKRYTIPELVR